MSDRPTVAFIGAGRVASALAPELHRLGYAVPAVASRSSESAERVAALVRGAQATPLQSAVDAAEVVFITTPDRAIGEVASRMRWRAGQAAVHCSGALTLTPLAPVAAAGGAAGSWHPFQTFGGPAPLEGATFGVDAEGALLGVLERLTSELGGFALRVPAEARALYHAASVMSCGYLTTLLHASRTLWDRAGLPPEAAMRAIGHIARSTIDSIERAGAGRALTGPTSRGDRDTVRLHLEAVRKRAPELLPLYREIGLRSADLAGSAGGTGSVDWIGLMAEYAGGGSER